MKEDCLTIYKFAPLLKETIWGGNKIASFKGIAAPASHHIGESWEVSGLEGHESVVATGPEAGTALSQLIAKHKERLIGEKAYKQFGNRFPLLVKFIDARQDLSIQVHPNDELARLRHHHNGKTEMWYIVDAEPGAHILSGFSRKISMVEYESLVEHNALLSVIASHPAREGDVYYLPAGRVHSIGAGCLLVEIQQTCDITYRIYDFGRLGKDGKPRKLHTALAKQALDFNIYDNYVTHTTPSAKGRTPLITCPYFTASRLNVAGEATLMMPPGTFVVAVCVKGSATLGGNGLKPQPMKQGETVLLPACLSQVSVQGTATFILAYMP